MNPLPAATIVFAVLRSTDSLDFGRTSRCLTPDGATVTVTSSAVDGAPVSAWKQPRGTSAIQGRVDATRALNLPA